MRWTPGYPTMTLGNLYDIVAEIAAIIAEDESEPYLETKAFRDKRSEVRQIIGGAGVPKNVISWRALQGKLGRIKRLKIFDSSGSSAFQLQANAQARTSDHRGFELTLTRRRSTTW